MIRTLFLGGLFLAVTAPPAAPAQDAHRPDLGFPPLPPVTADSPMDTVFNADRLDLPHEGAQEATLTSFSIPSAVTGTGFSEPIQFQLPDGYSGVGTPHPLIVAYHGFGGSAASPANQSTVDEEANARNWVYLSVTGLDDQLFGSPISQENTYVAIQWMLDNFNIDPDRVFMVGFSVGGGIVSNFAARHRDPDGIMIAGLGLVSSTFDWTMEYNLGTPDLQAWMENPYNFGGPPSTNLFFFQRSSSIYEDEASYPPTPGTLIPDDSLGINVAHLPIFMTYDALDFILHVPHINDSFEALLASVGSTVTKDVQFGTVYPPDPRILVTHSWYVLDEAAMFDSFDGLSVDRFPDEFYAIQEEGGRVSWITTTEAVPGQFVYADGKVTGNRMILSNVRNATDVVVDAGDAGLTSFPMRMTATSADGNGFRLRLTGFPLSPSRLHDWTTDALVTGVDSDPATGSLIVDVPANSTLDVKIKHDPDWSSVLTTSPNPVATNSPITVSLDGPSTSDLTYLVVSLAELYIPVGSVTITASPLPPAWVRLFPLDAAGDLNAVNTVPDDPGLVGLRFPTQALTTAPGPVFESVSNLWGLYVE